MYKKRGVWIAKTRAHKLSPLKYRPNIQVTVFFPQWWTRIKTQNPETVRITLQILKTLYPQIHLNLSNLTLQCQHSRSKSQQMCSTDTKTTSHSSPIAPLQGEISPFLRRGDHVWYQQFQCQQPQMFKLFLKSLHLQLKTLHFQ